MRKFFIPASVVTIALVTALLANCGARLPREVTLLRPTAESIPVDLSKVNFTELTTGNNVNVADYMDGRGLSYMVLTFSSKTCGICMEKAHFLQTNLVGHYELLGPNSNKFELHGVNTDVESMRPMVLVYNQQQGLSHINWGDKTGADSMMMTYFQPGGRSYSVPLTVMIDRRGILWQIASDATVSPEDVLKKIASTMGTNVEVKPTPTPTPKVQPAYSALAEEKPGRLKALPAMTCGATTATTAQDLLLDADLKFVVVDRGNCADGSVCDANRQTVLDFASSCQGKVCQVITLGEKVQNGDAACAWGVMTGGKEVFETFATHFNWNYAPVQDADNIHYKLPEVAGPVVLAFDTAGRLVFSKEGAISKAELTSHDFTTRALGPAYPIQTTKGSITFADVHRNSKYTVVQLFGLGCDGCEKELTEWSKPGNMIDWCAERPEFCQVLSVEDSYPDDDNPASVPNYFNTIFKDKITQKNATWRFDHMAMDADPFGMDGSKRWMFGWSSGQFGEAVGRAILYDIEGKVVNTWVSTGNVTEVFDELKALEAKH